MRVLFLNSDYPSFLSWLYRRNPGLTLGSYARQMQARNHSLFGTADFMSSYMARLGHAAIDVHANNRLLQEAWMKEHGHGIRGYLSRAALLFAPMMIRDQLFNFDQKQKRFRDILCAQIAAFQPTIIYNHDPGGISGDWLKSIAPKGCALVAQIAAPFHFEAYWRAYDLIISSLPNFVAEFRQLGLVATYIPLAFEPSILNIIPALRRDVSLSFVGSITPAHRERFVFLERMAEAKELQIWGDGAATLGPGSLLRQCHRGAAWGGEMFRILGRSCLTLNKHIDVSKQYANNMRLFEATGMGACLITDWKENLADLFEPGREVIAYRSIEECLDLVRYYSSHDSERKQIAAAGQVRCLSEHTYERRMQDTAYILSQHFD